MLEHNLIGMEWSLLLSSFLLLGGYFIAANQSTKNTGNKLVGVLEHPDISRNPFFNDGHLA